MGIVEGLKALWGGKRQGAGRKATKKDFIRKLVALPEEIWEQITPLQVQELVIAHFASLKKDTAVVEKAVEDVKTSLTSGQKVALEAMLSGEDVFISGGAGVGKSFLIDHFVKNYKGNVLVCAPTGVAANNVKGVTLHSLFGLKVKSDIYTDEDIKEAYSRAHNWQKSDKDIKMEVLHKADCIIIDEISMCRGDTFTVVMSCIEGIRDKRYKDKINKNLQVIVVGDFYQLPPILTSKKDFEIKKEDGSSYKISQSDRYKEIYKNSSGYCFLSDNWKFKMYLLTDVLRQKDKKFVNALNCVRVGDKAGIDYIVNNSSRNEIKDAVWICGKNNDADNKNLMQLNKINGKEYKFPISLQVIGDISYKEVQDEAYKVAKGDLIIKVGCCVVSLVNCYDAETGLLLYSNGSRGVVKNIEDNGVFVDFGKGEVKVKSYTWEIVRYSLIEKTGKISAVVVATFSKVPLVLGYATTVHKSQGQSLDAINIDSNCNFAPGQFYVALSRATRLDGIFIEKACAPKTSKDVLNFYIKNQD